MPDRCPWWAVRSSSPPPRFATTCHRPGSASTPPRCCAKSPATTTTASPRCSSERARDARAGSAMLASSLALMRDEPAGGASERRARWSAFVIVAALAVLLGTTLWLAFRYEQTEKQETLSVDVKSAAATIRSRLRETEQARRLSASELRREDGEARFRQAARELVIHNPALLRIERRHADGGLVDAIDAPAPRPRLDDSRRARLSLPTQLALSAAGGGERLAYSRPHYLQIAEGAGFQVIELAVSEPLDGGDVLFAVYSLPRVLDVFLPAEFI